MQNEQINIILLVKSYIQASGLYRIDSVRIKIAHKMDSHNKVKLEEKSDLSDKKSPKFGPELLSFRSIERVSDLKRF